MLTKGPHAATTWLMVMAVFLAVDVFTFVAAILELAGAWAPFNL